MNFDNKQQSLLTFRVGSILCCAPCLYVKSIITPPVKFTKPPGSNKANPGIFKHGSHIAKVIDLRQKFGVAEESEKGNLIIIIFNDDSFAFWVDQIINVFDFPSKGWSGLPAGIPRDVFSRTLVLNKNIHLYTEFEKLITIGELSCFKNHTQQKKETKNEDLVIKKEVEKIVNESNNKVTPPPSVTKKQISTTHLPKEKIKTNTVPTKTKKTPDQIEKHTEKNTNKKSLLAERKGNEKKTNIVSINPAAPVITKKEGQTTEDRKVNNSTTENIALTEDESPGHILKIIFVLLVLVTATAIYFVYPTGSDINVKQKNKTVTLKVIENTIIDDEPLDNSIEIPSSPMSPLTTESKIKETEQNKIIPHTAEIKKETTDKINPYHAEIKQEEKKVVIKVYIPQTVKKKIKPLIVHTVIKGDTLWAITEKYINDPFRYPELAALNKIKNPHRIYPGDQVQIRFIEK